jgi:hypothetical protein
LFVAGKSHTKRNSDQPKQHASTEAHHGLHRQFRRNNKGS